MTTAMTTSENSDFDITDAANAKGINPRTVREKAGLSVEEMAGLMAMSEFGYSAWEQGHRRPGGPAHQLLRLLADDPKAVAKVLAR